MNQLQIGKKGILFEDKLDKEYGLSNIPNNSISLTFTSPPYCNFIDYAEKRGVGYEKHLNSLEEIIHTIEQKTMPKGRLAINASNIKSTLSS